MELKFLFWIAVWSVLVLGMSFLTYQFYQRSRFPKRVFSKEEVQRHSGTELGVLMSRVNNAAQEIQRSLNKEFGELVTRDSRILRVLSLWKLVRNRISRLYSVGRDPKTLSDFRNLMRYLELPIDGDHDPSFRMMMIRAIAWDQAGKYWPVEDMGQASQDADLSLYKPVRIPFYRRLLLTFIPPAYPKDVADHDVVGSSVAAARVKTTRSQPPRREAIVKIVEKDWSGLGKYFESEIDALEGELTRDGRGFRLRCPNSHLALLLYAIGVPKLSAVSIMTMFLDEHGNLITRAAADQVYRKAKSRKHTKIEDFNEFLEGSPGRMWQRWVKFKCRIDEAETARRRQDEEALALKKYRSLLVKPAVQK